MIAPTRRTATSLLPTSISRGPMISRSPMLRASVTRDGRASGAPATAQTPVTVALGLFGALISRGLTEVIAEDGAIDIVARDLDMPALLRTVARRAPQVVVLDMKQVGELSGLRGLQALAPEAGIVLLAHCSGLARATTLFAAGANCLSFDVSARDLLLTVRLAASGKHGAAFHDGLMAESLRLSGTPDLTHREIQVLEYLSKGRSHAEIACALNVTESTMRKHSAQIRRKLKVRRTRELVGFPARPA